MCSGSKWQLTYVVTTYRYFCVAAISVCQFNALGFEFSLIFPFGLLFLCITFENGRAVF